MRCLLCNSRRILRFVDAFGEKRIFCKACRRSFLENTLFRVKNQTNLLQFHSDAYFKNFIPKAIEWK